MITIKLRKFLKKLFNLLIVSIAFCGCEQKKAENIRDNGFDSDLEYIMDKGNFIVGVTDFEPLDYIKNSEWIGFDADMAGLFAERLEVSIKFLEIDWDKRDILLNNGTIDCIWNGMTLSDEIRKDMACSMAYLNNAQIIVVPEENVKKLQSVEDCMHLLFAAEAGSAGEEELKSRNYRYTQVDSQKETLSLVSSGKVDAAVIDAIMAGALIGNGKKFDSLVSIDSISKEEYAVGFRKGSDLVEIWNDFWQKNYQEGVVEEIAEGYSIQAELIQPE